MDFSPVELSEEDQAFRDELRGLLARIVTDEVIAHDRQTGENFVEDVHLALAAAGHLRSEFLPESDGGFSAVRRRIWELEIGRAHTPWFHWGTTMMAAKLVAEFGSQALRDEVLPGVLDGTVRICLGYTEPEGGSDVATCKTRAVRGSSPDAGWIINGAKMFTSNAHRAKYVFLLTNTEPTAPKHKSLTMFLVPIDTPGIEIHPLRTVDGDRTNVVYYSDVRVDDGYRIGAVNGGWTVMRKALDAEHGVVDRDDRGLQKIAMMTEHGTLLAEAVDRVAVATSQSDPSGTRLIDDASVQYRLGHVVARTEAALSTPDMFGRVAIAQTMRDVTPVLMDLLGSASSLPIGTDAAPDDVVTDGGAAEYIFRLAGTTGIYGGTLEVFRNMIAQYALGLGRPHYAAPR